MGLLVITSFCADNTQVGRQKDRLRRVERVVPGWRRPYQSVREAAELFHHHLPQDVRVCDHHDWLAAHVIPEISIFNGENEKKSLVLRGLINE